MFENKYQAVNTPNRSKPEEEEAFLDESSSAASFRQRTQQHQQQRTRYHWLLICLCVGLSFIAAFFGALLARWWSQPDAKFCTGIVAHQSPVTKDLDITYHTVQFNGSFLDENIYRRKGSPEVDAAWEALGVDYRPMAIPEDQAQLAGIASDQVKIASKYGGGYPANLEGLHHLHCLNLVRKGLWFNYQYYHDLGEHAFLNEDHIVRKHVTHCLDIVRQQLMCTVDIGVLGQVWWQDETLDEPKPFVDFNTKHVCRNYDDIRQWAEQRQLPEHAPDDYMEMPKPGDRILSKIP